MWAIAIAYPVGLFNQAHWTPGVIPVALGGSALWITFEVLVPEPLALTVTDEQLRFEFRSRQRAESFARTNHTEVR